MRISTVQNLQGSKARGSKARYSTLEGLRLEARNSRLKGSMLEVLKAGIIYKFLFGICKFENGVSLVRRFVPGKLTACPGTDFASLFHRGNHRGRMYQGTSPGVYFAEKIEWLLSNAWF